jgi:hypothetical protein
VTTLTAGRDIRGLSDGEMADLYADADDADRDAIVTELGRRDRLKAARQARRDDPAEQEWRLAMEAQLARAEAACNGELVRRGSWVEDPRELWAGSGVFARAHCSEELWLWWQQPGEARVTVTAYRQQVSDGRRIQRDERDAAAMQDTRRGGKPVIGELMGAARTIERGARYAQARQRVDERRTELAAGRAGGAVAVRPAAAMVRQREPVDGDETLRYVVAFLRHFAVWGSDAEILTAALWVVQAHARDGDGMPVWQYCARLGIFGPSGSGKSWKTRLIGKLAPAGKILIEPTKPSFIDLCADRHTVILTEADELFSTTGRNRGILAVVNAGYEPDRTATRKQGGKVVEVPVFGPVVLDGLDSMIKATRADLRTMISRTICIMARQAPDGYRPPRFDKQARYAAEMLSQRCAQWMAQEVAAGLADVVPHVPEHLGNRPFALWEPLFAVAQRADEALRARQEKDGGAAGDGPGPWTLACAEACEQLEDGAGLPEEDDDDEGMSDLDRIMAGYSGGAAPAGDGAEGW